MILNDLKQHKLLAHKGRCFDIRYSQDNNFLLSACEDGNAVLWDVKLRKACATLKHNKESEVLRVAFLNATSTLIATCGADGRAILWKSSNYDSTDVNTNVEGIASSNEVEKNRMKKEAILPHGSTQIYACESLNISDGASSLFMTAADSSVFLWDANSCFGNASTTPAHVWTVDSNSSNNVSPVNTPGEGQEGSGYGGPRNPDNQIYIFDAKVNPTQSNVIALALSDGNVRQIDIRTPVFASMSKISNSSPTNMGSSSRNRNFGENSAGPILSSISLSGLSTSPSKKARVGNSHATSVCFSEDGLTLLAALGSGDVAVLDLRMGLVRTLLHSHTRTCYGAFFNTPIPVALATKGTDEGSSSSSSGGPTGRQKGAKSSGYDSEDENSKNCHKRNLDFSLDHETNELNPGSLVPLSSSQCLTWSSDCTVRSWDISLDGLCTDPIDVATIPDFPIFCCALKGRGEDREFVCGGGNGDPSFIGTPLHLFTS